MLTLLTASLLYRCGERPLNAPAVIKATSQGLFSDLELVGPLQQRSRIAAKFEGYASGRVSQLLATRCPSAVLGLIVSIIINSVQRVVTRRPWAHVGQERIETLPSVADSDATSGISNVGAAEASFPHASPDLILGGLDADLRLGPDAPAVSACASLETHRGNLCARSARTFAEPHNISLRPLCGRGEDGQLAENAASQIVSDVVNTGYSVSSHASSSREGMVAVRGWRSLVTSVNLDSNYPTNGAVSS